MGYKGGSKGERKKNNRPLIPEGPFSKREDKHKQKKTEKEEERNRAPIEEISLEQGEEDGAGRTTREEIEGEFNAICWE